MDPDTERAYARPVTGVQPMPVLIGMNALSVLEKESAQFLFGEKQERAPIRAQKNGK